MNKSNKLVKMCEDMGYDGYSNEQLYYRDYESKLSGELEPETKESIISDIAEHHKESLSSFIFDVFGWLANNPKEAISALEYGNDSLNTPKEKLATELCRAIRESVYDKSADKANRFAEAVFNAYAVKADN